MKQRGRKSAAEVEATGLAPVSEQGRPDADYSLTDEQAEVWHAVLEALPAGWIGAEALPVLAAYARTTVHLRRLGMLITQEEGSDEFDPRHYAALIRAHGQAAQILKTLATSLRLTPQSRLRAERAARTIDGHRTGPKPWEW